MNHQLELTRGGKDTLVDISPNQPEPILRVDAEDLESKIANTVIQIQLHRNGQVCKYWIDVSLTNQNRPRVRVSTNSSDGRKTMQKDQIGSWRNKRTPIDEWKQD